MASSLSAQNTENESTFKGNIKTNVLAPFALAYEGSGEPRKVIIDCDPSVDDAMELVLALQYPGIEIVGITTTSGHINIVQRTKNALRVVELSGKNIPVFQGSGKPLFVQTLAEGPDIIHGDDGLGNTNQPEPKIKAQQKSAAQFMVDATKANPGQITILALGRLTNLADAIRLDSAVTKNVEEVVVAAGALRVPGLVTPVAEPNVWMDPHAADMVFAAPWKVTLFGLDVTMKNTISDALLLRIKNENPKYGSFIYSISRVTREFQMNALHSDGIIDIGASPILYLIDPTIFKFMKGPVRVVIEGIAIGQTIMPAYEFQLQIDPSWKERPLVTAAYEVDVERFLKYYEAIMKGKQ
jgi:inosine-uridine nucleoside N-ribohydrolase